MVFRVEWTNQKVNSCLHFLISVTFYWACVCCENISCIACHSFFHRKNFVCLVNDVIVHDQTASGPLSLLHADCHSSIWQEFLPSEVTWVVWEFLLDISVLNYMDKPNLFSWPFTPKEKKTITMSQFISYFILLRCNFIWCYSTQGYAPFIS